MRHLSVLSFLCTFLVAIVFTSRTCLAQKALPKKYSGQLFLIQDTAAVIDAQDEQPRTETDPLPLDRKTLTSPSALPKLGMRVYVPSDRPLPDTLRDRVNKSSLKYAEASTSGRRFLIEDADFNAIDAALNAKDIHRIEIDRPQGYLPSPGGDLSSLLPIGGILQPLNRDARITHLVPEFLATFESESDKGGSVLAAVFDAGAILQTHVEFKENRVTVRTSKSSDRHSTHVAGTMAATGVNPAAIGMAEKLRLLSFDWENDLNGLDNAAAEQNPIRASNHSYGPLAGWASDGNQQAWFWWGDTTLSQEEDAKFGKYTGDNNHLDAILVRRPHLVTFAAAGNDRSDGPINQPIQHYAIGKNASTGELEWQVSTRQRRRDGFDQGGYDTIGGLGLSKNAICVGAIRDVLHAGDAIISTPFSSWGPTDDGRIKPDLVANGDRLLSTSNADDEAYLELSGTSMASPTAAGIGCLLLDHYHKVKGEFPTSDIIKAVLIHSATDAGLPGPDPTFGWGSINTLAAGRLIAGQQNASIRKDTVAEGAVTIHTFTQPAGGAHVRATLVWIDPEGEPNTGGLDDSTPTLVNDLDLTVEAPDGTVYFPYSLVRSNPTLAATHAGPNRVDNVEVVDAPPRAGNWKIRVRGNNLGSGSSQGFALVVTNLVAQ